MYKERLEEIINLLKSSLDDAIKFDAGNDAAGRRIRKDCHDARAELQNFRFEIQKERNDRKQK